MKKAKAVIIGAGCQGRAAMDILMLDSKVQLVGFIDDDKSRHGTKFFGLKVLGGMKELKNLVKQKKADAGIVGIGGYSKARKEKFLELAGAGLRPINAIHPAAVISKNAKKIGRGVFVGAGAIIGADCEIGDNAIVNNCACLTIGCTVGAHSNITPGAHFAAGVVLKEESYVGMGASIKQYTTIGRRAIVGAGAVVLKDVPENSVVFGMPAEVTKKRED